MIGNLREQFVNAIQNAHKQIAKFCWSFERYGFHFSCITKKTHSVSKREKKKLKFSREKISYV